MLSYTAALYDNVDNKWQLNRVNDLSARCYIKCSKKHYTYIQPIVNMNEKRFSHPEKDEIFIPTANVFPSPEVLYGILNTIILLYKLVISKDHSIVELLSCNKDKK